MSQRARRVAEGRRRMHALSPAGGRGLAAASAAMGRSLVRVCSHRCRGAKRASFATVLPMGRACGLGCRAGRGHAHCSTLGEPPCCGNSPITPAESGAAETAGRSFSSRGHARPDGSSASVRAGPCEGASTIADRSQSLGRSACRYDAPPVRRRPGRSCRSGARRRPRDCPRRRTLASVGTADP